MKNFADELNALDATAGVEEGYLWLTDGNGDEFKKAGRFTVLQTNNGPDLYLANGQLVAKGWDGEKQWLASYDESKRVWTLLP